MIWFKKNDSLFDFPPGVFSSSLKTVGVGNKELPACAPSVYLFDKPQLDFAFF